MKAEPLRSRCPSELKVGGDDLLQWCAAQWSKLSASLLSGLRRSLSEGFLLLEPQSPRFLSDSTIHRLIRPTRDLKPVTCSPSIQTLRKQLTQEGGSLNQMLLLLNGTKVESREDQTTGLTSEEQQAPE